MTREYSSGRELTYDALLDLGREEGRGSNTWMTRQGEGCGGGVSLGHALCDDGHPSRRAGQRGDAGKGRATRPRDSRVSQAGGTRVCRTGLQRAGPHTSDTDNPSHQAGTRRDLIRYGVMVGYRWRVVFQKWR